MRVHVDGTSQDLRTVWLEDGVVKLLDQRYLPFEIKVHEAHGLEELAGAIEDMVVRGAPAIGAAAAHGMAQGRLQGVDGGGAAGAPARRAAWERRSSRSAGDGRLAAGAGGCGPPVAGWAPRRSGRSGYPRSRARPTRSRR